MATVWCSPSPEEPYQDIVLARPKAICLTFPFQAVMATKVPQQPALERLQQ